MDTSQNKYNKAAFGGVVAAIAASLCCIAPVLALVAGTSGMATTFSWMEPFRPYLIALTVLILGLAWYRKLRSRKEAESDCGCAEDEKQSFLQTKKFLLGVTLFAGLMLAFPNYSEVFYSQPKKEIVYVSQSNIVKEVFVVEGMTCAGCEAPVEGKVSKLNGIISVNASYENANTVVEYDKTKVNRAAIITAISSTYYKVVDK
ncbi:mercuric transport protein MerTP [Antarcticibacterium sp. 1MA-6-2]|uniref:mercuric transport protein MerTP n=1 Tax=Antarcticibacterium sp. 1MA-6-2 TaxID=2908210 RepID=UPI001F33E30B|nr:mercuric transport protein MerTP [Antarcticibacterium sp. 1MA-6-2]UJH91899.1 mercuric transport protein MerTP [Antarcticibacterium sp. 1MA-6-2]